MANLPGNNAEWQQFAQMMARVLPENPLGTLAQWGTQQDNNIRDAGSRVQSPTISLDTPLNFEQRVLKPNSYPSIDNGDGSVSTHRMAWGEADGKYMAYPTIVQDGSGKLKELDGDAAFEHALKSGEYRAFDKPEDAESYAEGGYKKFWGLGEKKK